MKERAAGAVAPPGSPVIADLVQLLRRRRGGGGGRRRRRLGRAKPLVDPLVAEPIRRLDVHGLESSAKGIKKTLPVDQKMGKSVAIGRMQRDRGY